MDVSKRANKPLSGVDTMGAASSSVAKAFFPTLLGFIYLGVRFSDITTTAVFISIGHFAHGLFMQLFGSILTGWFAK